MSEPPTPSPAPAPPVSRWEVCAAGALAALHVAVLLRYNIPFNTNPWPGESWFIQVGMARQALIEAGSLNPATLLQNNEILWGIRSGSEIVKLLADTLIIPLAIGRAVGWGWGHRSRFVWHLALLRSLIVWVGFMLESRINSGGFDGSIPWYSGWLRPELFLYLVDEEFPFRWHLVQTLLVVTTLVLTRRKASLAAGEKG